MAEYRLCFDIRDFGFNMGPVALIIIERVPGWARALMFPLLHLPLELAAHVLGFVSVADLLSCTAVGARFFIVNAS